MDTQQETLVNAVRDAAGMVPPYGGDLDGVFRRHRVHRRRRAAAGAAAAVALVGLMAGTVPYLLNGRQAPGGGPALGELGPPAASAPAPAQRLLLSGTGVTTRPENGPEVGIVPTGGVNEVLADGSVASHRVSGVDSWYQAVGLPDGRLVVLGYVDTMPGVPRADGPNVQGLSIKLEVLGPGGAIELSREVRVVGENVVLLAATGKVAYLLRPQGLVEHDFASGAERRILKLAPLGVDISQPPLAHMDLGAGWLAVLSGDSSPSCAVRFADLTRPDRTPVTSSLASLACDEPGSVRLSPDGRLAAVTYRAKAAPDIRVAIVDTASGAVRTDRLVQTVRDGRVRQKPTVYGVAWSDASTIRIATAALPEGATRVYRLDEVLRVVTVNTGA